MTSRLRLIYGGTRLDREVVDADVLLREWWDAERDAGQLYLEYEPATPKDRVVLEDLAVTMLVNSRADIRPAVGFLRNCAALNLDRLPQKALGETTERERREIAELIGEMTGWPGVGASIATKTLHKKRPALIPILDNMAIFGAYMNPLWPEHRAAADTVKAVGRIKDALDLIAVDVSREENEDTWKQLEAMDPDRTRIELFDIVWWMFFSPRRGGRAPAARPQRDASGLGSRFQTVSN